MKMYKIKANVHRFKEYMEIDHFDETLNAV